MKTKTVAVPHHSFAELLTVLERQQLAEGLYIIEEAGRELSPGNYISYPFRSDHFIVLLQLEGVGFSKVNFTDCTTHKGHILTIPANAIRQFFELPPDCRFAAVVFTSSYLAQSGLNMKHSDMFGLFSSIWSFCIEPDPADFERLLEILKVLQRKYFSNNDFLFHHQVVNHLFHAFLYELSSIYDRCDKHKKNHYTRKEEISREFVRLLTDYFREERSVIFYAEQMHVTPRYLSQTVKEVTGKSAGELIDEMVIMEAKALLNNSSLTIAQVADALYFSDQFFFSKYFKRHAGFSPSEYKKSL